MIVSLISTICATRSQPAVTLSLLAVAPYRGNQRNNHPFSLLTTEAEYYTLGIACQEAEWIRQICLELLIPLNGPIHIYSDNTGAVALSENPVFHSRSKHIDIRWHFVHDLIRSKTVHTSHIPGIQNGADFLMKALNPLEHECCVKLLGMD